jgi:hypothetical protein
MDRPVHVGPRPRVERSPTGARPELAVLIPLVDFRGDSVAHLRTWTHEQTLPRERFQVVVATDGVDAKADTAVEALLSEHDVLERVPGADLISLWNAAASQASAPWLVITEAHCLADPACLGVIARAVDADPDLEAAMLEHGHVADTLAGDLCARWFQKIYSEWSQTDWAHLTFAGCVVRRDVFERHGPLDSRYWLFSSFMLSARLAEAGATVGSIRDARIFHVHNDTVREHHEHSASHVRGQFLARSENSPAFCERYFGHSGPWANRLRYRPEVSRPITRALTSALVRAVGARRPDTTWMGRELMMRACPPGWPGLGPESPGSG